MAQKNVELPDFIKNVNRGIASSMFVRAENPLLPGKEIRCLMDGLRVKFDVRVDACGHVTHGQDVAAKLHFEFFFTSEKINNSGKEEGICSEDCNG